VKAEELSTETVAVVGEVCVIVLGVTVSVNVQVPVSLKVSESVPETVYAPTLSGAPMTLMAPLAETLMLAWSVTRRRTPHFRRAWTVPIGR